MTRLTVQVLEDRATPATVPSGFTDSTFAEGLASPTSMEFAPDGRLFVTTQAGELRIVRDGELLDAPFLSVNTDPQGERGLLGVTFHPDFANQPWVYVYYTVPGENGAAPFNRVSRFRADGDSAAPGSEEVLLDLNPLTGATNHNGGAMHFGSDGKLYVAVGENATPSNSQSLDNLLGKVLRLNPDGSIPDDNPLLDVTTGDNRAIWAYGLRNPFTFAVQPGSGQIYINDVGQNTWEEINRGEAGANYGWPQTEGPTDEPGVTPPLFAYPHSGPTGGAAITGGDFYNPPVPVFGAEFLGDYFFTDAGRGWLRRLDGNTAADLDFATGLAFPVDIDAGPDGALYYLERGNGGRVGRIAADAPAGPSITSQPQDVRVGEGQPATFRVGATGTGTLRYQWRRGGADLPGENSASLTLADPSLADSGTTFDVVVSDDNGSVTSDAAELTVIDNRPPEPTIDAPGPKVTFVAGDTVAYAGTATDPETGALPASAFSWEVTYHTGDIVRPFVPETSGVTGGEFTIPQITPYLETDVFYRVRLTVTDPDGLAAEATRDIFPEVTTVTLASSVADTVLLDGSERPLNFTFDGVAGVIRELEAVPAVESDGRRFVFDRWSDGGPRVRNYETPTQATRLEAFYVPAPPLLVGTDRVLTVLADPADARVTRPFDGVEPRVAAGDVTGDGIDDVLAASGPGITTTVRWFDGQTGAALGSAVAFEEAYTGGAYVASADIDGDDVDDIIVSADVGGGPRVRVFSGADGSTLADFFGIEDGAFRGGARVAAGDMDGDGVPDLLVAAGAGGGPRLAMFDGRSFRDGGGPRKLTGDVFVFEESLRDGAFLAAGDVDGDGGAEAITAGGPGGGPRVRVLDGASLVAGSLEPRADFFAGDTEQRGGVRVAAMDVNGDGRADVVTGAGAGSPPEVRTYLAGDLIGGDPQVFDSFLAEPSDYLGGVFVG